jgi:hypothetical protein
MMEKKGETRVTHPEQRGRHRRAAKEMDDAERRKKTKVVV